MDHKKLKETIKDRRERLKKLTELPDTMDIICAHLASNGTLLELCELWDVTFGDVMNWIHKDETREELWFKAQQDRVEWLKHRVKRELEAIAFADLRDCFDDQGRLLKIKDMPERVARSLASCDLEVKFVGKGDDAEEVTTKKIKFNDKLKAIDSICKQLGLYIEKVEHSGSLKFEDLVGSSMPDHLIPKTAKNDDSKE